MHSPDAPTPATKAPLRAGSLRLAVRDLPLVQAFYESVLGLETLESGPDHARLGAGGAALLELVGNRRFTPAGPRAAGLFHAAFLLPDRASLGAWLTHAASTKAPIVGASDHIVSEAVYLSDPEGNGVEVYADRPPARWRGPDGAIRMSTGPLDIADLAAAATAPWAGFPSGGTLGHVHLQVGALGEADRFWRDGLGLDLTTRYPGASFYATGGYHHHIAANIWNSSGAPRRLDNMTGLQAVQLVAADAQTLDATLACAARAGIRAERRAGMAVVRDPWNIEIELTTEQTDAG